MASELDVLRRGPSPQAEALNVVGSAFGEPLAPTPSVSADGPDAPPDSETDRPDPAPTTSDTDSPAVPAAPPQTADTSSATEAPTESSDASGEAGAAPVESVLVAEPVQESPEADTGSASPEEHASSIPGMPGLPPPSDDAEAPDDDLEDPADLEVLMEEYDDSLTVRPGEICKGIVVSIGPAGVIVDIGGKTEGLAAIEDFRDQAGDVIVKEGEEIDVFVESRGAVGEYASLSFRRAQQTKIWAIIEEAEITQETIHAHVTGRVKGGLAVDLGVPAFLPGSQVDLRPVRDLDSLVGQSIPVRVVRTNRRRGNVVVSRRTILEEERNQLRQETLKHLAEGAVVSGTVKNVTDYGAFVDLGGIDGLIHVTDISYGRIKEPSDVLQKGQTIEAKVLSFDEAKGKVSLSLKHMKPDPWESIAERYKTGEKATGKVASLSDYGVFVELDEGVEGLVHVSELTWSRRRRHPSKIYKVGDPIEVMVVGVKHDERRISISVKRMQPDPWSDLEGRLPVGTVVEGRVRNLASYGAFVEVEEGVDGLIHVTDLSWDRKLKAPQELVKKGDTVRAVVLRIDHENRRLSLGLKQLQPNVWEAFFSCCLLGDTVTGRVTRKAKFGCFVELAPGVEGLCHNLEIPKASAGKKKGLEVGESYSFCVIKLDEFERRIGLSRRHVTDAPESAEAAATA